MLHHTSEWAWCVTFADGTNDRDRHNIRWSNRIACARCTQQTACSLTKPDFKLITSRIWLVNNKHVDCLRYRYLRHTLYSLKRDERQQQHRHHQQPHLQMLQWTDTQYPLPFHIKYCASAYCERLYLHHRRWIKRIKCVQCANVLCALKKRERERGIHIWSGFKLKQTCTFVSNRMQWALIPFPPPGKFMNVSESNVER